MLDKGDWGFIVQRYNTNGKFNKTEWMLTVTGESYSILHFDYRINKFYIENSKNEKNPFTVYNSPYFFRDIDDTKFIQLVSTEKTKHLLELAYRSYGRLDHGYGNRLHRGLPRVAKKPVYQILVSAGFTDTFLLQYKSIVENDWYERDKGKQFANFNATTPHEILGLPKYLIPYLKNLSGKSEVLDGISHLDQKFGADNTKNILDRFLDECDKHYLITFLSNISEFIDVVENYNYEPKRLTEYICRDVKLNQGIMSPTEALGFLKDYMRMMTQMKLHPEKYSKSLKKDHDIANMNYQVAKDQIAKDSFKKIIEQHSYKNLMFNDKEYAVIIPAQPEDLVNEGSSLSHCVASYVQDVVKEKCKILFVRKKDKPEESLLTVEVRNGKIIQVRGFGNRNPMSEEKQFISKWAEKKQLLYVA